MSKAEDDLRQKLRSLSSLKGPFRDFDLASFPDNPQAAFRIWLNDAIDEGIKEPHQMTLSTVDENGHPDARVLILKNVDERGWHFAAKAESPKGRQISNNPNVALTFYWPQLGRQVRLRGNASQLPPEECAQDFLTRPFGSKTSAIASKQSQILGSSDELQRGLQSAAALLESDPKHVEPGWKVYAVAPKAVEFWQGATDRLHKRLEYVWNEKDRSWDRSTLWP